MKPVRLVLIVLVFLLSLDCSTARKGASYSSAIDSSPAPATALTKEQAILRSHQVSHISYQLWFGLDNEHDIFSGRTVLNFELKPRAKDFSKKLMLDFEEGTLSSVVINGTPLAANEMSSPTRFDGHHIYFDYSELQPGMNRVEIAYNHPYSKNGSGLYRYQDPADQKIYLYSDFEPYDAHRMFPCFDQPDLKATYEVTAAVPPEWQVISNTKEKDVSSVDGKKSWSFPVSSPFSTYVFALHAGPYVSWKSDAGGIPIRLFARKSLARYVDHAEWLDITRRGLAYYNGKFGYPYPFGKYDQILVPDFNAGAMENVGAVTFSERYIYRTKVTTDRRRDRADTILHEMAHMWFGDLVTMKWWNGLWLNESFATFMAAGAVDKATWFKGSWQDFLAGEKEWAYWEDQLVTTHAIDLPIADTDESEASFDGITYGKGASVLKQLAFYLGEDDFREGIQRYFQRYANRNTTVGDFVKTLAEAGNKDLTSWQQTWLQTAGVNTVTADWACETDAVSGKNKISKFNLVQGNTPSSSDLRVHKTEVALYSPAENKPILKESIPVSYSGALTQVTGLIGRACPEFVFPNYHDQDYVKVILDPKSLDVTQKYISSFQEPLIRQMLWHTLWESVVDGNYGADQYAELALNHIQHETDTLILSKVLGTLVNPNVTKTSVEKFLAGDARVKFLAHTEALSYRKLLSAPPASDQQLIWYHAFLDVSGGQKSLDWLEKLLKGSVKLSGFPMDQEHRWEIVEALARNGAKNAPELIAEELKNDPTDFGLKESYAAEASIPDPAYKAKWMQQILGHTLPVGKLRFAMAHFNNLGQEEYIRPFVDAYFNFIPKLSSFNDEQFSKRFSAMMFPSLCDPEIVSRTSSLLTSNSNLPAFVVKNLKVARQEEERCIRARAKTGNTGPDAPLAAQK